MLPDNQTPVYEPRKSITGFSRRKLIVFLDTTLLVIVLLLLSPRLTGLALHEWLGFLFFFPVLVHLLIAWPFANASRRSRFNFVLNFILFILVIIELASGFMISQVVLPRLGLHTINDRVWRSAHNLPLNFVVLCTGLHIATNWGWIVAALRKTTRKADRAGGASVLRFRPILLPLCVLLAAAGLVSVALYGLLGSPTRSRLYGNDEIGRFIPDAGHGLVQLLGEAFLLALVVFISLKWLRART